MISVRLSGVMTMPLGNWMPSATWRDELDVAGLGRLTACEVEVRAVDVDVAALVHDDLVPALPGVGDHRPVGLLAP